MHFCPGVDEIVENHRISAKMQVFPDTLKCRKMDHGIGILMSVKSDGLIIISCGKRSMIDGNKRTFYIPVFNIQPKMDQWGGILGLGIIKTSGETVDGVFDIVSSSVF